MNVDGAADRRRMIPGDQGSDGTWASGLGSGATCLRFYEHGRAHGPSVNGQSPERWDASVLCLVTGFAMRHPRWPSVLPANVEELGRRVCLSGANRRCQRRSVMPLPQTIHPNISSVPPRSPIYPRPSISADSAPAESPQGPSTKPGLNSPNIPPTHKKEHRPFPSPSPCHI